MTEFTIHPFLSHQTDEQERTIADKLFSASQLMSAKSDQITGLPLKQFFLDDLERRIYESSRYEVPVSVCLISVENISPNDADEMEVASSIRSIANFLETFIRQSDLPTWFSPNEFLVEMPHVDASEAEKACERIENALNGFLEERDAFARVTAEQAKAGDVPASILERIYKKLSEASLC